MMRSNFDRQLDELKTELVTMGTLCENAISMAIKALLDGDAELRERVFAVGDEVLQNARDIESACMKLLLRQQPVARDLRAVSSALKMIYDMERIGTLAGDIAEISIFIDYAAVGETLPLKEMAIAAIGMVSGSIESFVRCDPALCRRVIGEDDRVDAFFSEIKQALIDRIVSKSDGGGACIDLLMIAKYLEKIGDHAENIAGWVWYSLTGERSCHASEPSER